MSESDGYNTENEKKRREPKKRKIFYDHKYNHLWENDYKWICASSKGPHYFKCKGCRNDYKGGIAAVKKHEVTSKHQKNVSYAKLPSVHDLASTKKHLADKKSIEISEIKLASFIAEHNISINTVDHLISLILSMKINDDSIKKISCNRTKTTALINNVIGLTNFEKIVSEMKVHKFSILVDESTDISSTKHLALVVRINSNWNLKDKFLTLIPLSDATSKNMFKVITEFFVQNEIPYVNNMIGFASDGANSMMGIHNSLKTLLQKDIPKLYIMKCICHSLALCANYACTKLPVEVETLIRDIYNFMHQSYKRQSEFEQFQMFFDLKPNKLLQPSQTRWLSIIAAVKRVLDQYEPLKSYFMLKHFENDKLAYNACKNIHQCLNNPIYKLYLEFLDFILPVVTDLNAEFQAESPKTYILYSRMADAYKFILSCYIKNDVLKTTDISTLQYRNPINYKSNDDIYCGPKVALAFTKNVLSSKDKVEFQTKCLEFFVELAKQMFSRFPFNSKDVLILKDLSFLNPDNIKNVESLGSIAHHFIHLISDINVLDREWRIFKMRDLVPYDSSKGIIEFWKVNLSVNKGDDQLLFPVLNKFVSDLFVLPHSSASVERVFSTININKTKTRNRLSTKTLTGLLHTKQLIKSDNKNCYDYEITNEMLKKFNNSMYHE